MIFIRQAGVVARIFKHIFTQIVKSFPLLNIFWDCKIVNLTSLQAWNNWLCLSKSRLSEDNLVVYQARFERYVYCWPPPKTEILWGYICKLLTWQPSLQAFLFWVRNLTNVNSIISSRPLCETCRATPGCSWQSPLLQELVMLTHHVQQNIITKQINSLWVSWSDECVWSDSLIIGHTGQSADTKGHTAFSPVCVFKGPLVCSACWSDMCSDTKGHTLFATTPPAFNSSSAQFFLQKLCSFAFLQHLILNLKCHRENFVLNIVELQQSLKCVPVDGVLPS